MVTTNARLAWTLAIGLPCAACSTDAQHSQPPAIQTPASEATRDVPVTDALVLRGRLLDARGQAAVGWELHAEAYPAAEVGPDGRFELSLPSWRRAVPVVRLQASRADPKRRVSAIVPADSWPDAGWMFVIPDAGQSMRPDGELSVEVAAWLDADAWTWASFERWRETQALPEARAIEAQDALLRQLTAEIAAAPNPETRDLMRMAQFLTGGIDARPARVAAARAVLATFGVDDPRWAIAPRSLIAAVIITGEHVAALDAQVGEHPQPELAAYVMVEHYIAATTNGEWERAEALWRAWESRPELAETFYASVVESHGPTRPLAPGRIVERSCGVGRDGEPRCFPEPGRLNLVELWATYCAGCIAQMPELRRRVASLRAEGIELAVFSVDPLERGSRIEPFVAANELPGELIWYPDEGQADALAGALELLSVPRLVLLDGEGRVLASDPQLHLENLDEEVRRWAALASPDERE